jgi:hypothetical protein
MNSDTFAAYQGGTGRNALLSQTLASTTETAIALGNDSGSTTLAAVLPVPQQTGIVGISNPLDYNANSATLSSGLGNAGGYIQRTRPYFQSGSFDADHPFRYRWVGRGSAVANAGNTLTLRVYQGVTPQATTGGVIGTAGNIVATTAAIATASSANLSFLIEVTMAWDSTQQLLHGWFLTSVLYNNVTTFTTSSALSHNTSVTTAAGLSFFPTVQWGNAVGGTIVSTETAMEQV